MGFQKCPVMKKHVKIMIAAIVAVSSTTAIAACWKNCDRHCPNPITALETTCFLTQGTPATYPFVAEPKIGFWGKRNYQSTTNKYCDYTCSGVPYGPVYHGARNTGLPCVDGSGSGC